MFSFIKKNLIRKMLVLVIIALIVAIFAAFYVSLFAGLLIMAVSVTFFIFFLYSVHRPFTKVIREMKSLLAAKKYNRIFSERIDEWGVFAHFFNEVTKNLERISLTLQDEARMSSELTIAADIQKMVLPAKIPQVPGLDIFVHTRPQVEIGGDNYDVIRSAGNSFIYVGDVTGHGVPSGLVMMMANTLLNTFTGMYDNSYDVVTKTNSMMKSRLPHTMFMTMVMLRFNEASKKMYFTGAGHEYVMIFRKSTNTLETKRSGGIAIGMLPDISKIVKEEELIFDAGDFLVLYSDGIVEARNSMGEEYGMRRFQEAIQRNAPTSRNANELFTKISTEFAAFVGDQPQGDDITLMVIKKAE